MKTILPIIMSGFLSEISGPGYALHQIGRDIQDIKPPEGFRILDPVYKPYSVLPGSIAEFIDFARTADYLVLVLHSFGFAAGKWYVDALKGMGILGKVLIVCGLDGVPNTDRFDQFDPSQLSDMGLCWGVDPDVAMKAFMIFQRSQLFPQGSQIRQIRPPEGEAFPSHWNKPIAEILGADPGDNHCDIPADPAAQEYVRDQVNVALQELAVFLQRRS